MKTPVTQEIAKLLREKNFHENCDYFYSNDELSRAMYRRDQNESSVHVFAAPIIAEVVMWIYEKHGIWISVRKLIHGGFYYEINKRSVNFINEDTPTQAYTEAILYTLKNLI